MQGGSHALGLPSRRHATHTEPAVQQLYLDKAQRGWAFLRDRLLTENGTMNDGYDGSCSPHTGESWIPGLCSHLCAAGHPRN
jgi:hypothetical protein